MLMLLVDLAVAGSLTDLDTKYGFRDVQLGTAPTDKMVRIESRGTDGLEVFTRPGDPMGLGGADLVSIQYIFTSERLLLGIEVAAAGDFDCAVLRRSLEIAYGNGVPRAEGRELWAGKRVVLDVAPPPPCKGPHSLAPACRTEGSGPATCLAAFVSTDVIAANVAARRAMVERMAGVAAQEL